jgi:hypothetical protein
MEIIGIILLIVIIIGLTNIVKPAIGNWIAAFFCSVIITMTMMLVTMLLTVDKYREYGVKEYLQYPEKYSVKVVYEDSIPMDTIVELK